MTLSLIEEGEMDGLKARISKVTPEQFAEQQRRADFLVDYFCQQEAFANPAAARDYDDPRCLA